MHKFYNCILFILLILILYSLFKNKNIFKKPKPLPVFNKKFQYIETQNAKDYTKQIPNIHTTTNMFQIN